MKDFFENFGKRFGETAEMVTNKAGEMIEIQRVKSQIRDLARENAVDMMELGKAVYERYKSGEELDDSTAQICDSIKEREKEIEKYERKIAVLKGSAACVKCGERFWKIWQTARTAERRWRPGIWKRRRRSMRRK